MVILIAVVAILLTIIVGLLLAAAIKGLDTAVIKSNAEMETEARSYNPAITLGYQIQVEGDRDAQLKEARRLAAKQAAATPRGANMKIGPQYKQEKQATAFSGINEDPVTAVKIASVHGWDGIRTGMVAFDPAAVAAPVAAAPAAGGKIKLVPGQDYPVIELTDSMAPDEKRKARIANAKAKSAAMKAAKAAQQSGGAVPTAAAPVATAAPVAAAPVATGVAEPEYTEITDDMSPEDKRKARIANSKAKSAYNKALKAAGVDPSAATAPAAVAAPAVAPAAPATPAPAAMPDAAAGIPKPELVEITDGMSPEEKRNARIANSKAKSAYNKALKAAGIDPKSVK